MKLFSKKGFTLIELLVVIAVLGVLAAAVVAAINPASKINAAKDSSVKSDVGQIVNALQAKYTNTNPVAYTAVLANLVPDDMKSLPVQQAGALTCTGGTAVANQPYCYAVNAGATAAAVWGALFTTGNAYWCWDSTSNAFKSEAAWTTVPTVAAPTCP